MACFITIRRIQDVARKAAPNANKLAASDTEFPKNMHCLPACRMPKGSPNNPFPYSMLSEAVQRDFAQCKNMDALILYCFS